MKKFQNSNAGISSMVDALLWSSKFGLFNLTEHLKDPQLQSQYNWGCLRNFLRETPARVMKNLVESFKLAKIKFTW